MNKGPRIIEITGVKGVIIGLFMAVCLSVGFIVFPAKVAQFCWNYLSTIWSIMPRINLLQGALLWAIVAIGIYLLSNRKLSISLSQPMELSEDEIQGLLNKIRAQKLARKLASKGSEVDEVQTIDMGSVIEECKSEPAEDSDKTK